MARLEFKNQSFFCRKKSKIILNKIYGGWLCEQMVVWGAYDLKKTKIMIHKITYLKVKITVFSKKLKSSTLFGSVIFVVIDMLA